jgi:hypothetical protein
VDIFSFRAATWLGVAVVAAGTLGTAGCSSSSSSSSSSASVKSSAASGASGNPGGGLSVRQLVFGSTLKHTFQPDGKGAGKSESLSKPDDLTSLGGRLFAAFQNGVDSQGETAPSGNNDSTVVEFTPAGKVVRQWDVTGKVDGLGTDAGSGQVIATVNEDGNSSLYAISPASASATHYTYSEKLPHLGGTDSVTSYGGRLLISASAPGTSGKQPASAPAVYAVTLKGTTARVSPYFADNATATVVNGPKAGKTTLALTDPDSSGVVPSGSSSYAGDFVLDSQADQELIFTSGSAAKLSVLKVKQAVDDSAWVTSARGTLYASDPGSDTIDAITGLKPGSVYSAETPCDAANAPTACPGPGFPANSLVQLNLKTGALSSVAGTTAVNPQGLTFVP